MASQIDNTAWLDWMSTLMGAEPRQSAPPPSEYFFCLLDELPLHLIPYTRRKLILSENPELRELFPNPECSILSDGRLPQEIEPHRHRLRNFDLKGTVAWVRDPAFGCLQPFWLSTRLADIVSALVTGKLNADSVPRDAIDLLVSSGILTTSEQMRRACERWSAVATRGAELFREKGYAPIPNLIHPFHVAALRRYYRQAIRRGKIHLGDEQSSRRYVAHNEPVAGFFHHQIASTVGAVVGESVKPSYVYFASYMSGAELKKHTDREQCEFSVTLCLDFSPEPEVATSWPIRLDVRGNPTEIHQALGDGLVYRGTRVPHYRDVLPQGFTSTSIFFHYVPQGFAGPLD